MLSLTQFNVISFGSAAGIFQLLPRIPVFKICVSRRCVGVHLVFGNSNSWNEFHFRVKVAGTQIRTQWEVYKKMCFQCIGEGHTKCWFPLDQQLCVSLSYPASQVNECNQVKKQQQKKQKTNKMSIHCAPDLMTRSPEGPIDLCCFCLTQTLMSCLSAGLMSMMKLQTHKLRNLYRERSKNSSCAVSRTSATQKCTSTWHYRGKMVKVR